MEEETKNLESTKKEITLMEKKTTENYEKKISQILSQHENELNSIREKSITKFPRKQGFLIKKGKVKKYFFFFNLLYLFLFFI